MKRSKKAYFVLVFPAVFMFTVVMVVPLVMGTYYSFTDWSAVVGKDIHFIGLENYKVLFTDKGFIHSFFTTFKYAAFSIISINVLALSLAFLVTRNIKLKNVYRAGFFIPNLIGGIVLGYLWQFIFNSFFVKIGEMLGVGFLKTSFLTHPQLTMLAMVMVGTWQYAGYIMMIYVASIQNVSEEVLEASALDGAKGWTKFRYIMLPLIMPAVTVNLFLSLIHSFKTFDINFALNNGGPGGIFDGVSIMTNELLALNIYNTAFSFSNMALAQAKSIVFFVVLVVIALIQVYFTKRKEVEA